MGSYVTMASFRMAVDAWRLSRGDPEAQREIVCRLTTAPETWAILCALAFVFMTTMSIVRAHIGTLLSLVRLALFALMVSMWLLLGLYSYENVGRGIGLDNVVANAAACVVITVFLYTACHVIDRMRGLIHAIIEKPLTLANWLLWACAVIAAALGIVVYAAELSPCGGGGGGIGG